MKKKRKVEILVLSDIHLGTRGCHARELCKYLKTIKPKILILNGDIIDFWQFSKRYWPSAHMKVIKQIITMASKGTVTYYITGNHDETLRKFAGWLCYCRVGLARAGFIYPGGIETVVAGAEHRPVQEQPDFRIFQPGCSYQLCRYFCRFLCPESVPSVQPGLDTLAGRIDPGYAAFYHDARGKCFR